ncbi:MAG: hypothetical protein KKC20_04005, partial [Proteobacteria bacterium]|nr:hypothetical protein [Pseudomonadota bacterium]
MNLAFSDINMVVSNLVQADALPSGVGTFGGSENRNSLFADNLNQVLKDAKIAKKAATDKLAAPETRVPGKEERLEKAKNLFLDEVDQEQGLPFLSKLHSLFLTLSEKAEGKAIKTAAAGMMVTGTKESLEKAKPLFLDEVDQEQGLPFLLKLHSLFLTLSEKAEGKAIKTAAAGMMVTGTKESLEKAK